MLPSEQKLHRRCWKEQPMCPTVLRNWAVVEVWFCGAFSWRQQATLRRRLFLPEQETYDSTSPICVHCFQEFHELQLLRPTRLQRWARCLRHTRCCGLLLDCRSALPACGSCHDMHHRTWRPSVRLPSLVCAPSPCRKRGQRLRWDQVFFSLNVNFILKNCVVPLSADSSGRSGGELRGGRNLSSGSLASSSSMPPLWSQSLSLEYWYQDLLEEALSSSLSKLSFFRTLTSCPSISSACVEQQTCSIKGWIVPCRQFTIRPEVLGE